MLTLREPLGTWRRTPPALPPGETVVGIVRSVEDYGVFIEIAPNLAGLAEPDTALHPGQTVSVYIKSILPDKMKIKLVVVNKNLNQKMRFEPHYFCDPWAAGPVDLLHPAKPQADRKRCFEAGLSRQEFCACKFF